MNARDELAAVIVEAYGESADACPCEQDLDVADHILAAGYSKPRTISTVEEIVELGRSAAILAANGTVWVHDGDHAQPWASVVEDTQGGPVWADGIDISLPATVLHEAAA